MSPIIPYRRQVEPEALPGVRQNPNAPEDAFGGPRVPDLTPVVAAADRIASDAKAKADQVRVLDAHNQLVTLRDTMLYAPDKGVLTQEGPSAMAAASGLPFAWQIGAGKIVDSLSNDDQKAAVQRLATGMWGELSSQSEAHVNATMRDHDAKTTDAAIELTQNDVVRNYATPALRDAAIAKGAAIAKDFAMRNGYSAEQRQAYVSSVVSRATMGALEQHFDNNDDMGGVAYFQQHRDALVGKDLQDAERLFESGSLRGFSQQQADTILAKAPTLSAGLRAVAQIRDPRVRDATEERVRRGFEDKDLERIEQQRAAFSDASRIVEQTSDFDKVPLRLRFALSPEENGALQRRAEQIRKTAAGDPPTDHDTFGKLRNMAYQSVASREAFARLDLTPFRDSVSAESWAWLTHEQDAAATEIIHAKQATANAVQRKQAVDNATFAKIDSLTGTHYAHPHAPGAPLAPAAASVPAASTVPGGPLFAPSAPPALTPSTVKGPPPALLPGAKYVAVPPEYVERARTNPQYRDYLIGMGADPALLQGPPSGAPAPVAGAPLFVPVNAAPIVGASNTANRLPAIARVLSAAPPSSAPSERRPATPAAPPPPPVAQPVAPTHAAPTHAPAAPVPPLTVPAPKRDQVYTADHALDAIVAVRDQGVRALRIPGETEDLTARKAFLDAFLEQRYSLGHDASDADSKGVVYEARRYLQRIAAIRRGELKPDDTWDYLRD